VTSWIEGEDACARDVAWLRLLGAFEHQERPKCLSGRGPTQELERLARRTNGDRRAPSQVLVPTRRVRRRGSTLLRLRPPTGRTGSVFPQAPPSRGRHTRPPRLQPRASPAVRFPPPTRAGLPWPPSRRTRRRRRRRASTRLARPIDGGSEPPSHSCELRTPRLPHPCAPTESAAPFRLRSGDIRARWPRGGGSCPHPPLRPCAVRRSSPS
jgi:hypothetical protein